MWLYGKGGEMMCLLSAWRIDIQCIRSAEICPSVCTCIPRFYVIWIIDCMCKWQELCTHITHRHMVRWAEAWSFDISAYENDGYTCGPRSWHSCSADNSWASLCMDLPILIRDWQRTGAPGCTEEIFSIHTLACVCVFQMVSDTHRGLIHIHSVHLCRAGNGFWCALDHWDSLCAGRCGRRPVNRRTGEEVRDVGRREGERGTEQRFGCRLCHFLLGEGDSWEHPSMANGQHTHTHTHSQMHTT